MSKEYITNKLSVEVEDALDRLDKPTLDRLSTVMRRPNLRIRMNRGSLWCYNLYTVWYNST